MERQCDRPARLSRDACAPSGFAYDAAAQGEGGTMMPRGFRPRGFRIGELGKLRLRRLAFAAAMMGVLAAAVPARAEDPAQSANPAFITVGAGAAGVIADRDKAGIFHFEYRSEEHTSELQSLMRISYAVFCL